MKKAKTVDEYLRALPPKQAAALRALRKTIKAAAPAATERISWGVPMFYHHGMLVAFAAFKEHCSFVPCNGSMVDEYAAKLKGYETTKGTIHFTPEKPLPVALVRRIVKERIAQNEAKR